MIKTIAIIILSVTFFGLLFFILVRNALKKKIDIEARPTSKIDQDVYDLLLDEFQTDKSDKDKLEEINTKFKILTNGSKIIDLGAAPGSWSQYISRNFNNSKIISIDLKEIEPIKNSIHIKGDFTEEHQKLKLIYFRCC